MASGIFLWLIVSSMTQRCRPELVSQHERVLRGETMGHVNSAAEIRFKMMKPEASLGTILLTIKCIKSEISVLSIPIQNGNAVL